MTKVHFIGVCGTAMATVAVLLKQRGLEVRGSDEHTYAPMSDVLARHGIEPLEGYSAEHIAPDVDLVVVGNAVSRGNPEVEWILETHVHADHLSAALLLASGDRARPVSVGEVAGGRCRHSWKNDNSVHDCVGVKRIGERPQFFDWWCVEEFSHEWTTW